jgi:hypothetical protein
LTVTANTPASAGSRAGEVDDGLRFLELSMRVNVGQDPVGLQRQLEQAVRDRNLEIAPGQQTKTSTVLKHLAITAARR